MTRLVVAWCLGRGSLCLVNRSISLQISHPFNEEDYILYKWRRICQYLPQTTAPILYRLGRAAEGEDGGFGQWRLRVGSKHFTVAANLLYPDGLRSPIRLTSEPLELLGGDGVATLWADRGRITYSASTGLSTGRLNLTRHDWASADLVREWIGTITGAHSELIPNPRTPESPMLAFEHSAVLRLSRVLGDTWMAQAPCVRKRFEVRESEAMREASRRIAEDQRLQAAIADGNLPRRSRQVRRGLPIQLPTLGHQPLVVD